MKRLRVTVHVDPDFAPPVFNLLANSPDVEAARVLEVNTTLEGVDNLLLAIDGDASTFADRATDSPGVEAVELSEPAHGRTYALVVLRSPETSMFGAIQGAASTAGLVVRTPFVYRDGKMFGRAVGDPESLQRALGAVPDGLDVQIDEVGRFRGGLDDPTTALSERQREALGVALALGYYEQPRRATHEDVAATLDCAAATASDHLQKAEAKLVRTVMDEFGPDV